VREHGDVLVVERSGPLCPRRLGHLPRGARGRERFRLTVTGVIASICFVALASCDQSPPSVPPRPAADLSVPPGLVVVAEVSEPIMFSGAAMKGDAAAPLFLARLTPRAGQAHAAPGAPAGSSIRLRVAAATLPERGEEASWIRTDGAAELPKSPGTAEYIYTGGEVTVRVTRDEAGRLVFEADDAPGAPKK